MPPSSHYPPFGHPPDPLDKPDRIQEIRDLMTRLEERQRDLTNQVAELTAIVIDIIDILRGKSP